MWANRGFRHDGRRIRELVAGGSIAPASLVELEGDPAAGGCPIGITHATWVTAHTPQERRRRRELKEQELREWQSKLQALKEPQQQQQEREQCLQERPGRSVVKVAAAARELKQQELQS